MKPNRKDPIAPLCLKTTSTIGTITAGTVAVDAPKQDEILRNLRENVTFIGWMSIIASTTLLLCTGLTMQWHHEVVRYMMLVLRKSAEMERSRAMLRRGEWLPRKVESSFHNRNVVQYFKLMFNLNLLNSIQSGIDGQRQRLLPLRNQYAHEYVSANRRGQGQSLCKHFTILCYIKELSFLNYAISAELQTHVALAAISWHDIWSLRPYSCIHDRLQLADGL